MKRLGIYYGWPSVLNGASSLEVAAEDIAAYDVFVLGGGLESPEHDDHANTRVILDCVGPRAEVFGYVALGPAQGDADIKRRVDAWSKLGVAGVFFDEAGFDFGNDRKRQNMAFKRAHRRRLRVFVNAFDPDDLFDSARSRRRVALEPGDLYLYESFVVRLDQPEDPATRRSKLDKLDRARQMDIHLYGVTTSAEPGAFNHDMWRRTVAEAREHRFAGVGWGEHQFGAADGRLRTCRLE